ncbi:cytochrome c oxidase assembly protein subunit 15 [Corynebacterium pollutisoli]|uniref:Cytochrome c oxidase assembly protein subunit 15 n=1 Tax=Corynebacterium pollutisoli TaxID=1610489 RepID=A0A1X7JT30_9CORY|nr:cytochrome c oxidase assembly protein subunit 15 [Corynebacterium pollutisoli]
MTSATATDQPTTTRGPSVRLQRILAFILLLAQGGITVTGSIVRVTGSGLGCDTWPNCHEGSLVPVQGAAPAVHQAIEFGNRLLTFVLAAIAIAVFVAVLRAGRRKEIIVYSVLSGVGIIIQAILGGISVHLDLKWWAVAIHFLPSMVLVWIAALLYMRLAEPDHLPQVRMFAPIIRTLTIVAAVCLSVVLVTGTMTTGAGVHSGDDGVGMEGRLDVDIELMALIHAGTMYVYLAATLLVVWLLYRGMASRDAKNTGWVLLVMIGVQWAIGVVQFNLGVPRWTIPAHVAMSSVVVAFSAFLYAHGLRRITRSEKNATVTAE